MRALEQSELFGGKTEAVCVLCGLSYPVELLVAAHLKRRSNCTIAEKLDFRNIFMRHRGALLPLVIHPGEIVLRSEVGKGSTFSVWIPDCPEAKAPSA